MIRFLALALSGLVVACSKPDPSLKTGETVGVKPTPAMDTGSLGTNPGIGEMDFEKFGRMSLEQVHATDSILRSATASSVNDGENGCISDVLVRWLKVSDDLHGALPPETPLDTSEFSVASIGKCDDNGEAVTRKAIFFKDSSVAEYDEGCHNRLWVFSGSHFPYGTTPGQSLESALKQLPQPELFAFVALDGNIQNSGRIRTKMGTAYFSQTQRLIGWRYDSKYICN